jgi:FkbM family methyltransferase
MSRRIAFILASTDVGPMILNRLDFDTRTFGGVGLQILEQGNYEIGEIDGIGQILNALRQTRGPGVVAIDGGANIGTHTVAWAHGMRGWGNVIAVEPQERTFYALCGNIALNNLSNARAFKAVLGREAGEMTIPELDHEKETNFGGLSMDKPSDPGNAPMRQVKIRVMAIDGLELVRLDLLKLDVEGMEPAALGGAKETIGRCRPIIVAEHIQCGEAAIRLHLPDYELMNFGMNVVCIPQGDPIRKMVRVNK